MKLLFLTIFFISLFMTSLNINAQSLATEDVLEELTSAKPKAVSDQTELKEPTKQKVSLPKNREISSAIKLHSSQKKESEAGNLPAYARRTQPAFEFETPTVVPKNSDFDKHVEIKPGDVLKAVINHNIVAYPGSKSPVTARVLEGKFKGSTVFGEAFLDASTKRINVTFKSIRPPKEKDPYSLTGILLADDGLMGIDGIYESNYWTYFWAETLANTVSGFADATTKKNQNVWGSNTPDPGVDPAARQGVAHGLSKTAEKLAEKSRNALERSTAYAPTIVQITVTQ